MRTEYLWIGLVAILWGSYPLVSRSAGYYGPRAALVLMLTGFVPIALLAWFDTKAGWPGGAVLLKLVIAGLMMGCGLIAFVRVTGGAIDASVAIPIADVGMLLVSAIGAMLFFHEPLTWQKGAGIALMLSGIALLRPA